MADPILSDPGLLAARAAGFQRLARVFGGEPGVAWVRGVWGTSIANPFEEPERWMSEALDSLVQHSDALKDESVFRPLCVEFGPFGVHFVGALFGARVYRDGDQWWGDPLGVPVGSLVPPDLDGNATWALARRLAEAFLASGAALPLFGMPTIASALNVAVNLHGEDFLLALATDPDAADRDLQVINRTLVALHRWYLERFPSAQLQPVVAAERTQPPGFGQICGCTTHLLSARMYREHVAPLDDALLSAWPRGGMIHLCGVHTHHVPVWREMESLRAVQLNDRAAADLSLYFEGLREDQVIYLNPCEGMTAERAIVATRGRRLVVVGEP
jgi:hypothetical protein